MKTNHHLEKNTSLYKIFLFLSIRLIFFFTIISEIQNLKKKGKIFIFVSVTLLYLRTYKNFEIKFFITLFLKAKKDFL